VNTLLRTLYWFVAGGLLGFGVLSLLSIGAPLMVLALILIVIGAIRLGPRGAFGAFLGAGLVPFPFLLIDILNPELQPAANDQTGTVLAIVFGAIALAGVAWGVLETARRTSAHRQ
jgi:hypothetical protein